MENNFFQIVASAGHAVAYTIGRIIKHIIVPFDSKKYFFNPSSVTFQNFSFATVLLAINYSDYLLQALTTINSYTTQFCLTC